MTAFEGTVMLAASSVAGMVNSIAGGGSLITFPMLVWLGREPILANATNTVSLSPGSVAALHGFRRAGVGRVFLEVTAQNDAAIRLYHGLGFRRRKTVYKAVDTAAIGGRQSARAE